MQFVSLGSVGEGMTNSMWPFSFVNVDVRKRSVEIIRPEVPTSYPLLVELQANLLLKVGKLFHGQLFDVLMQLSVCVNRKWRISRVIHSVAYAFGHFLAMM